MSAQNDFENPDDEYQDTQAHDDVEENNESPEYQEEVEAEEQSSEEDSEEESQEQEREEVKPQKIDIRERLSQVQRERYQAMQEAEALRQENELLRKSAEISAGQAVQQYEQNLETRYQNAKAAKARAMEEGDFQAQIDADAALAMISSEYYNAQYSKAQAQIQSNQYQNYPQPYQNASDNSHYGVQWIRQNSWFSPHSPDYDPEIAQAVDNFCNDYDYNLEINGQGHLIQSPEYLNEVSRYASALMSQRNQGGQRRELNMRQSRTPVAPVRNGYARSQPSRQNIKLSQDERELCRGLGISEKAYVQQKLMDQKQGLHKMNRGM